MSKNSGAILRGLIETNVNALEDGLELVQSLNAEQFTQNCEPAFQSNIGVHFRHLVEHYICFLEQWQSGLIRYEQRRRDLRLEMDLNYTEMTLLSLCEKLKNIDAVTIQVPLKITDQPFSQQIESGLERELLFLHSHTVHHYAMIAAMARSLGNTPKQGFGVAIATQIHLGNMVSKC